MQSSRVMPHDEWVRRCNYVTDEMKSYTRAFITALSTSNDEVVRLVGTGTFVDLPAGRVLLTCEHVSREGPMEYRFCGTEDVFRHTGIFCAEPYPIDASFARVGERAWSAVPHSAMAIPHSKLARQHSLAEKAELLFIHGFAGENSQYGFDILNTNASAYCSQQIDGTIDDGASFEIFWDPSKTQFVQSATTAERKEVRFDNPGGLSGSIVWNTRYCEMTRAGRTWTSKEAVVTGLVQRWDDKTKSLLVLKIENLLPFVEG